MEKLLPQNIEAESGALGSIIIDPEAIVQVSDFLRPEDFYRDAHRTIYEVILHLYQSSEPADFITICDELERTGRLEDVGGASYITSLINQVPTSGNVEYYGHIVERTATLRRLIHAAGQIAAVAYDEADADTALDKAEKLIFEISQRHTRSGFSSMEEILADYMTKLEQLNAHRGTIVGIPTGFTDLDRMTGGLQRSDLIVLAARPGMGKTSLALSLAHNTATKYKNSVAVFSLEMSKEQLVQRLLSMDAGVDQQRLRTGWIEEDEWDRIVLASDKLSEASIWIDDTAGISTMEMRSKSRRLLAEHGVDLIIVDYLQLMQANANKRSENRVQEVSEISRSLKGLARELNVPVVALSQLSRSVESRQSKVPQLSDLRESGCITGESLVYLPYAGTYKSMAQLVGKKGFYALALNTETWQLEPREVTNVFTSGRSPIFRLTTRLGRSIRTTANHKFLTIDGWQRLDKLVPGTHLALPRRLPGPIQATLSNEELTLLGHLLRDDCMLSGHALQCTTPELELAETVASLAGVVFGKTVVPHIKREHNGYQVCLIPDQHLISNELNTVEAWLSKLGIYSLRPYQKFVPEQVFAQPVESIAQFLRSLCLPARPDRLEANSEGYTVLSYASSSKRLCQDVQALLLRLDINATLAHRALVNGDRDLYQVNICESADQESFFAPSTRSGNNDVYWDEIASIAAEGEEDVYDLTVDILHNFVANDFILKNSIEQDSDIVMFIYRDEAYNQDSERKNIADLIVAKHRNGPVGEVSLYFQASQTRFRDLEMTPTEE